MALLHFERGSKPLASRRVFFGRVAANAGVGMAIVGVALAVGMIGYRAIEGMSWLDAFLNAAMLLGGMGPVDPLHTDAGKVFAGVYALFCGLLIVLVSGLILAPILHRVLHALHLEDSES
ncbi:MAG: hypothetical protein ACOYKM_10135 [Caulobacterales bacterium]|jgi:hypothetical protein